MKYRFKQYQQDLRINCYYDAEVKSKPSAGHKGVLKFILGFVFALSFVLNIFYALRFRNFREYNIVLTFDNNDYGGVIKVMSVDMPKIDTELPSQPEIQ